MLYRAGLLGEAHEKPTGSPVPVATPLDEAVSSVFEPAVLKNGLKKSNSSSAIEPAGGDGALQPPGGVEGTGDGVPNVISVRGAESVPTSGNIFKMKVLGLLRARRAHGNKRGCASASLHMRTGGADLGC